MIYFVDKFRADPHNKNIAESKLSAQIKALVEHYKQKDPLGLPGAPVPDPFEVPYTKKSIGIIISCSLVVFALSESPFSISDFSIKYCSSISFSIVSRYGYTYYEKYTCVWIVEIPHQKHRS